MMLTKNRIREIKSLEDKKERNATGLFTAEGNKLISDLIGSEITIEMVYATPGKADQMRKLTGNRLLNIVEVSEVELKKISQLKTPQGSIAVCRKPVWPVPANAGKENLILCLEEIQDPGNFGTIIRLADWFGIGDIFCSPGTTDIYNPKVVQATMGAIGRVRAHYLPLIPLLSSKKEQGIPVYGTFLDGENVYSASLSLNGIITLGNEGKGISRELSVLMTRKITIPDLHSGNSKPDSLNVSTAASIIVSEFRRRLFISNYS